MNFYPIEQIGLEKNGSEGVGLAAHNQDQFSLDLESDDPIDLCPLNPNGDTICEACQ